jgi:hypothetical protein
MASDRKIIQIAIAAMPGTSATGGRPAAEIVDLYALADDGTVWARNFTTNPKQPAWFQQPQLPKE